MNEVNSVLNYKEYPFDLASYKTVYEHNPQAFAVIRVLKEDNGSYKDIFFVYANNAYEKLSGFSRSDLIGHTYTEIMEKYAPGQFGPGKQWNKLYGTVAYEGGEKTAVVASSEIEPGKKHYVSVQCFRIAEGYVGSNVLDISDQLDRRERSRIIEEERKEHAKYDRECDRFSTAENTDNENLIAKAHFDLTVNKVLKYEAYRPAVSEKYSASTFDETFSGIDSACVFKKEAEKLRMLTNRKHLLGQFRDGTSEHSLMFALKEELGIASKVRLDCRLIHSPETGNVELFAYLRDETAKRLEQLIIEKIGLTGICSLGYICIPTGSISFYIHDHKPTDPDSSEITEKRFDERAALFRDSFGICGSELENAVEQTSIPVITSGLEKNGRYSHIISGQNSGRKIHMRYDFCWLEKENSTIFFVKTDITEQFERQITLSEQKNAAILNNAILDRLALEATDYVALIDAENDKITLHCGSFFGKDKPTPEKLRMTSYSQLLENMSRDLALNYASRIEILSIFSTDQLLDRLKDVPDLVIPYNFMDVTDKGSVRRKQLRYSMFDTDKKLILTSCTDITQSFEYEKRIEIDERVIKKSALDSTDLIAILHPNTSEISLRFGSWTDAAPQSGQAASAEKTISLENFVGMTGQYISTAANKQRFSELFSIGSIVGMLENDPDAMLIFDLCSPDDPKAIYKKQFRFTWLDDEKQDILITRTDITRSVAEEQRRSQQLRDALDSAEQSSRAKTEFLSHMSHDIRTPMNAIIGFSTLLLRGLEDPQTVDLARTRDEADKILSSAKHLLGLINDVLDMSKIEAGNERINSKKFMLSELISSTDRMIRPQAEEKSQRFDIYVSDLKNDEFFSDETRLRQILINLLSNAVKYTGVGGHIELRIKGSAASEDPISSGKRFEPVTVEVKDNGIGMSEEFRKVIFEPFSRETRDDLSEVQGTGLGMALTRNIVHMLGGTIDVRSSVGEGTVFTALLPLRIPKEAQENYIPGICPRTVLIIDDEDEVCRNILGAMADKPVRADSATNADKALAMISSKHSAEKDYELIITDDLPDTDMPELIKKMRDIISGSAAGGSNAFSPVIIMTGYDSPDAAENASKAGADGFLPKPFFCSSLRSIIMMQVKKDLLYNCDRSAEKTSAEHSGISPSKTFAGLNILAVEDNELNAEILREILRLNGAEVTHVPDGLDAYELFRCTPAGEFDVIFMDIQMPLMDGYECTKAIRALSCDMSVSPEKRIEAGKIPIIAMTANAFSEDVQHALLAGMNAHVPKPIDIEAIARAVERTVIK
ncbi:MAG: response regulator [Oscillospiraceae bacterium]|nr:response regulator [Oscillospiraceae bacterium]